MTFTYTYRNDLDGVRAFAILAVMLFHAFPYRFPFGFSGVDVFFVLSGYVITQRFVYLQDLTSFDWMSFLYRRVNRLVPALLILLLVSFLWVYYFYPQPFQQVLAKQFMAVSTFSQNWFLGADLSVYGDSNEKNPLLHLWSLSIEFQFYILFALFFRCFSFNRRKDRWLFVSTIVFSFVYSTYLSYSLTQWAFYSVFSRWWEFGLGVAVALYGTNKQGLWQSDWANGLSLLGVLAWIVSICIVNTDQGVPVHGVFLPIVGTICFILAGPNAWFNRVVLSFSFFVSLGRISYALYLWHWVLLAYLFEWAYSHNRELSTLHIYATLFISGVIAWLSTSYIEEPCRSAPPYWRARMSAFFMITLLVVGGVTAIGLA